MTTSELINKALNILKGHDFYYMMDDYAYTNGAVERAKASMLYFVEVANEIGGEIRETLRALWIATYNYCACFRPFWTSEKAPSYKEEIDTLTAKVQSYIA